MDREPPLKYNPEEVAILKFAGVLLPRAEFKTVTTNFPAVNCLPEWGTQGHFFLSFVVYSDGKLIGRFNTECVDEKGILSVDFDNFLDFQETSKNCIVIGEYTHPKTIPVELYFSNIHRKTNSYVAYPVLPFVGDTIYQGVHATQLENTLFWPGIMNSENVETGLVVVNPYKLGFSYQVSLYSQEHVRAQTEISKIKPYSVKFHSFDELFPNERESVERSGGQCSLCIAAQYKVIAYVMIRERKSEVITTFDHLHTYCMV